MLQPAACRPGAARGLHLYSRFHWVEVQQRKCWCAHVGEVVTCMLYTGHGCAMHASVAHTHDA